MEYKFTILCPNADRVVHSESVGNKKQKWRVSLEATRVQFVGMTEQTKHWNDRMKLEAFLVL